MGSEKLYIVSVIIAAIVVGASAGKILFLLPIAYPSHVQVFESLIRALGDRGHDIVALTPIISLNMPPSVIQIQLINMSDISGEKVNPFERRKNGQLLGRPKPSWWEGRNRACVKVLQNPILIQEILTQDFDLVIVNIFMNHCLLGIIAHFKAPSIYVSTFSPPSYLLSGVGNRLPPSFVPTLPLQYSDRMTFAERLVNSVVDFLSFVTYEQYVVRRGEAMYREYLPNGTDLPGIDEIRGNVSMIFANSHFTLNYPRPLLPNVIEVGGMHLRAARKLPKELNEFLRGCGVHGFIYFSMGSIIKPKDMPEETRKVFVKTFSKLKQCVVWKWDEGTMTDISSNVLLQKWLPQQDILGHPNIKLFITHGGLLSIQESVYHGVPLLGLPMFGDQDLNIGQAEKSGYAKYVEIIGLTEKIFEEAVLEMINNPKYAKKVKHVSRLFRDLPEAPLDKAVYWTEYVLRHKGASHLRSAARNLTFYQYYLIDVAALVVAFVLFASYLALRAVRAIQQLYFALKRRSEERLKKD